MAEIVVGLLGPAIELGKCIVVPIKRQFNYLCCFDGNVKSLDEEAKRLEDERAGLQMEVERAMNYGRVIDPKVVTWLEEVNEIQQKKRELATEITNLKVGDCLSGKSRYSASRRAVKTTIAMKQKQKNRRDITVISHPPEPVSMVPIIERPVTEFESRKEVEEDLIEILKDEKVVIMGICGMGGVGKTTLAQKIKNRVMNDCVFGESVMVVVSQPADIHNIQGDIADQLSLELKEKSLFSRAQRLSTRLRCGKRILVVLDDVWEYLDLKELGIPCETGSKGCKVLLTSRNRGILARMDAQPIRVVETLTKIEAWSLFKEKLGTCADDQNQLSSLAEEIADECKGLPLALVSVAGALKYEVNISVWKDALLQLRSSNPEDLSDVLKDVYVPLKLSYDYLSSQNARYMFLLCCLFPEDFNIPLEYLSAYAMGLRMFEGISDLKQTRDKTCSLIHMLKSRFLLLEGWEEAYVKMHDVVRDVAIFIASKEKRLIKCGDNSTWISSSLGERIELSNDSTFPNLRLLLIDKSAKEELQINDYSFKGMKELNVLSIRSNFSLKSLLLSQNLRTLVLVKCKSLKTISIVSELLNLEILICCDCHVIEEFPSESLKCLILLEISNCRALEKIGSAEVISSLDKMNSGHESRHITITFQKLESLRLLNLPNLKVFYQGIESIEFPLISQLEIRDCPQLKGLVSSSEDIRMGDDDDHSLHFLWKQKVSFREITNCENIFYTQIPIGSFSHLEELRIKKCHTIKGLFSFSIAQNLESLKLLKISNCKEMVKVIDVEEKELSHDTTLLFPHLEELRLYDLPKLKNFCNYALGLPLLVNLDINDCPKMGGFSLRSIMARNMTSLKSLAIRRCMIEQVFLWDEEENEKNIGHESQHTTVAFEKLESLRLLYLPNLRGFYQEIESIEFPVLSRIEIKDCPQLKSLVLGSEGICTSNGGDHSLCKQKVSWGNLIKLLRVDGIADSDNIFCFSQIPIGSFTHLEQLRIQNYSNIKSLFSYSTAQNLESLKILKIESCNKMAKVIEEDDQCSRDTTLLFPHLEKLTLICLPKLKTFCNTALAFPKLAKLDIDDCPEMGGFYLGSLTTPNLESLKRLRIRSCSMMEQVFFWREAENGKEIIGQSNTSPRHLTFPKLKNVKLYYLLRLTNICKGVESIEFPCQIEMSILHCPNLKSLVSATTCSISGDINNKVSFGMLRELKLTGNTSFESVLCSQIPTGSFTHLEELLIDDCSNIRSLFSFSIARNLESLKILRIERCMEMVKVIEATSALVFPQLEKLSLSQLPKLEILCNSALGLPKLVNVDIDDCPEMKRFNSGSLSTPDMESLESLRIWDCSMMEQVFSWSEEESEKKNITFQKLKIVKLHDLPRLTNIYKGIESIEFPRLTEMSIRICPNLKSLVSATTCSSSGDVNNNVVSKLEEKKVHDSLSIWDQIPTGNFTKLEFLSISGYDEISSLFSSSVASTLVNLNYLIISDCVNMVKVIGQEVEEYSLDETTLLFPCLKELFLDGLPKLKIFCDWRRALEFQSLERIEIDSGCPKMERFSLGSLTTPNLKTVGIEGFATTIAGDLNDVLWQSFTKVKEKIQLRGTRGTIRGGINLK